MVDTARVRFEVERLLFGYTAAADVLDVEAVADLFGAASVDFAGRRVAGRSEIYALFSDVFAGAPRVKHLISNLLVTGPNGQGDPTVSASCAYTRWPLEAGMPLGLGEYSATFTSGTGGLRFASFTVRRLWSSPPPPPAASPSHL